MSVESGIIRKASLFSGSFFESLTLTEFGFLWSVAFAPWGPLLRYLGWTFALTGLLLEYKKGKTFREKLDPYASIPLLFILAWGVLGTFYAGTDLYNFFKYFSLALEFGFSLWLAAFVFNEKNLVRFSSVLFISASLVVIQTVYLFLTRNHFAGPFGNIHNLGLYSVIVLPIAVSYAFERRSISVWLLSGGLVFTTILGSSSSSWITGACGLTILFFICGNDFRKRCLLILLGLIVLFASSFFLLQKVHPALYNLAVASFSREKNQILSIDNPIKFSSFRSIIWKGAVNMVKERPILGWGWKPFHKELASVNASWWDEATKDTPGIREVTMAHNMYLGLAIYGGLPTTLLVVWIYVFSAYRAFRLSREKPGNLWFWLAVFAVICSFFVYSLAGDIFAVRYKYACVFWYLLGFASQRRMPGAGRDETMSPVDV